MAAPIHILIDTGSPSRPFRPTSFPSLSATVRLIASERMGRVTVGDKKSPTQKHEELLSAAMKRPGVAEVMRIYQAANKRAPQPTISVPLTRFTTGGNA